MLKQQTNSRNHPILFDLPFLWLIKKCNWFENFNHFFKISPLLYMESNLRNGMASYSQTQEYSSWGTHWLTPLQEIICLFTCASKCTIDSSRGIDFIHLPKHCLRDQRSPSPSLGWHPHFLEAFPITSKLRLPQGKKNISGFISPDHWHLPKDPSNAAHSFIIWSCVNMRFSLV